MLAQALNDSQVVFHWFPLGLAQVLRAFCIAGFPVIYVVCSYEYKRNLPRGQRARFLALALFAFSAAYTETYRFFSPVTPRLFVNVAATVAGLVGCWAMRTRTRGGQHGRQAE